MSIQQLNNKLEKSLDVFVKEIDCRFPKEDNTPATYDDLHNLSDQFRYTLDEFRKHIIEELK